MTDEEYRVLLGAIRKMDKRIDDLEAAVNTTNKDMADDRKKIDDNLLSQGRVEGEVKQMREDLNTLSKTFEKTMHNTMQEVTVPVIHAVEKLSAPHVPSLLEKLKLIKPKNKTK